jgi:hypothetical protein
LIISASFLRHDYAIVSDNSHLHLKISTSHIDICFSTSSLHIYGRQAAYVQRNGIAGIER